MQNPHTFILEIIDSLGNKRAKEVIGLRFGLFDGQPRTLQEIGDKYGITRERVRQIQESGLENLFEQGIDVKLKPFEEEISEHLRDHGELRHEERLLDDLVCFCLPAKEVARLSQDKSELNRCRAALNLILILGKPFDKYAEDNYFYPFWTVSQDSIKRAKKTIDSAVKHFKQNKTVLKDEELFSIIKKALPGLSDKAIHSYIEVSKLIGQNHFGDFGLTHWPEISPRGVRDKAYLIFKKENRPLHFAEVTNLINQLMSPEKPAYLQTVHNELIKDPRFVLIGRGIYALRQWGYTPGTVADVIKRILKEKGPMSKEEILKNVMAQRLIKENSVLINLQNKKCFKKLEDGRFALV